MEVLHALSTESLPIDSRSIANDGDALDVTQGQEILPDQARRYSSQLSERRGSQLPEDEEDFDGGVAEIAAATNAYKDEILPSILEAFLRSHENLKEIVAHSENLYYGPDAITGDKARFGEAQVQTNGYAKQGMSALAYQLFTAAENMGKFLDMQENLVDQLKNETAAATEVGAEIDSGLLNNLSLTDDNHGFRSSTESVFRIR
ncbi:hypothetical protein HKX48_006428 [Thoreauomyces humboldtii]|nr:hypothetical protein HKX48_006428 [Thoreauomyces humboldtii]